MKSASKEAEEEEEEKKKRKKKYGRLSACAEHHLGVDYLFHLITLLV